MKHFDEFKEETILRFDSWTGKNWYSITINGHPLFQERQIIEEKNPNLPFEQRKYRVVEVRSSINTKEKIIRHRYILRETIGSAIENYKKD